LYILGLLDRPTDGRYLFDGVDTSDLSSNERAQFRNERIGFVFQNFHLLARNSAIENVEVPLLYSGYGASQRRRIAQSALDAVGMIGRDHHLPNQLSGGQQQRVAIARALANQPSLILADEPTGALDSATSTEVMEVMQRLNRERGITIVLVTHDRDIASYADYTIRFRDGQGMRRDGRA
jgi:putative ABC transport system ATP-binding protein